MRLGTKTILFGAHQALVHTFLVIRAWKHLYSNWPTWRDVICIAVHDLGYWGCKTIDGEDGEKHPEFGARIARHLLGDEYGDLVLLHSRSYCRKLGRHPSRLCYADKLATAICPEKLYLFLARLSGELDEYRASSAERWELTGEGCPRSASDAAWFESMRVQMKAASTPAQGGHPSKRASRLRVPSASETTPSSRVIRSNTYRLWIAEQAPA